MMNDGAGAGAGAHAHDEADADDFACEDVDDIYTGDGLLLI